MVNETCLVYRGIHSSSEGSLLFSQKKSLELSPRVGAEITVRGSDEKGTGMPSLERAKLPETHRKVLIFPGTERPPQVDIVTEEKPRFV